jgi:hypothetical protein
MVIAPHLSDGIGPCDKRDAVFANGFNLGFAVMAGAVLAAGLGLHR